MKVLIKFSDHIETVDNVSVDDKCFPVVAGLHPYPSTTEDVSPLVRESALWFKTLAVEAVYIDCDYRSIYWQPIVSSESTTNVLLRRSTTKQQPSSYFIPASAKPLFKDNSVYDFDASLKEMMGKCSEAVRKFLKRSQSIDHFHKTIVRILHMYILPSITFSLDDMFCLTRAQCLIEVRLAKSENEIANKANSIMSLRQCLVTLKNNLLLREKLDSETYLRTCNRDFLLVFLKTIETDVESLNIELAAQQSKVNWAKQHPDEIYKLGDLQAQRDNVFHEIDQFIRVREAIKNVISRRDLTKRKMKKCEVINSCFHNIFIEIIRRLDGEDRILSNLGGDKVNICAAREAVECTINEMISSNRNSDRATKFEPEDFANFSVNVSENLEKSTVWLTFQERVTRILGDPSSMASKLHREGCCSLNLKINLALSEFYLTNREGCTVPQHHESAMAGDFSSTFHTTDVTLRNSKNPAEHSKRRDAVLIDRKCESYSTYNPISETDMKQTQTLHSMKANYEGENNADLLRRRALSTNDIHLGHQKDQFQIISNYFNDDCNQPSLRMSTSDSSFEDSQVDEHFSPENEAASLDNVGGTKSDRCPLRRQRHIMTKQLALGALMNAVESLKSQTDSHFREVISCLTKEITRDEVDEASGVEQQELLWKSYDRFFCQEVYGQLMKLYKTGLTPSINKAYTSVRTTSLHEILKEDMLLDLFFGDTEMMERTSLIPTQRRSEDVVPISRSISNLSLDVRCFDIKDLYTLANTDSVGLSKRFNLDDIDFDDYNNQYSSNSSHKSSDLSSDEETFYEVNTASQSMSVKSSNDFIQEASDETEKWKTLSDVDKVNKILDPVLSNFKKSVQKCLDATCFLDKVRYITKAIESLNNDISKMIGPDFQSACDHIISMLILALYHLSEEMFINLYINLRLILDVLPNFFSGTLWEYSLVTLCASYDYLFTLKVCDCVVRQYPGSFRVRR